MSEAQADSTERRRRGRPRAWSDKTEQNTLKSLDRAMAALERLGEMGGATLTELSEDLGQAASSIYRVLFTLEARDIVEFDPATQRWHVGAGAFLIGSRFLRRTQLVERARPIMRALMQDTGETANLGIERDGLVLFVGQVETHANIRAFFPPGTMSPMHASGIGKALLAQMDEKRIAGILAKHGLERFTPGTLVQPKALMADLSRIRARGYSVDAEEKDPGMRCVASAVIDAQGEAVAGLSVSGPSSRFPEDRMPEIGAAVIHAARTLTRAIGGQPAS